MESLQDVPDEAIDIITDIPIEQVYEIRKDLGR